MSHRDDDDIDDEALRALRPVWLAMPDEEPPSRGLDALLAAARVKADEMKASVREADDAPATDGLLAAAAAAAVDSPRRKEVVAEQPSLWARFVASFLRPQVLAVATIMILVGGAVFISQRRDKMQHDGPAVSAPADESRAQDRAVQAPAPQAPPLAGSGEGAAPAANAEAELALDPATVASPTPRSAEGTSKAATTTSPRETKKKAPKQPPAQLEGRVGGGKAATGGGDTHEGFIGDDGSLAPKGDLKTTAPVETAGGAAPDKTAGTKLEAGTTVKQEASEKQQAAEPSVKQLHERARAAAARGECATVRALAKEIARTDAPYYRANIAPDKTLATCLN